MSEGFHAQAFTRADSSDDAIFFGTRQPDTLMDLGARTAVGALYRTTLPEGGALLDLMAARFTHLPEDVNFDSVTGLGIAHAAMSANPDLTSRVAHDLNANPELPFEDDQFDAVMLCDGLAYLTDPVAILREVARVLKPGRPLIISFSDNFHASKAVALWQALDPADRVRLVTILLDRAGFVELDTGEVLPPEDLTAWADAVHAVIGRAPIG